MRWYRSWSWFLIHIPAFLGFLAAAYLHTKQLSFPDIQPGALTSEGNHQNREQSPSTPNQRTLILGFRNPSLPRGSCAAREVENHFSVFGQGCLFLLVLTWFWSKLVGIGWGWSLFLSLRVNCPWLLVTVDYCLLFVCCCLFVWLVVCWFVEWCRWDVLVCNVVVVGCYSGWMMLVLLRSLPNLFDLVTTKPPSPAWKGTKTLCLCFLSVLLLHQSSPHSQEQKAAWQK